jgi:hypothetical protein
LPRKTGGISHPRLEPPCGGPAPFSDTICLFKAVLVKLAELGKSRNFQKSLFLKKIFMEVSIRLRFAQL